MSIGPLQLVLILVIVFVIFGAGKLPRVMGDVGKGIRSLREGLKGEEKQSEGADVSIKEISSTASEESAKSSDENSKVS